MPYITPEERESMPYPETAGQLNYEIHALIDSYLEEKGDDKYQTYNDVIGALECVKHELYRRLVAPLEDKKIEENGDVRPYVHSSLCKPKEDEDDWIHSPSTSQFDAAPLKDDCAIDLKKHGEWYGLDSDDAKAELLREIEAVRPGWWLVSGIRNTAYVRAIDEYEAIEIAHEKTLVDKSWESPTTQYLGKDLPKAFGI